MKKTQFDALAAREEEFSQLLADMMPTLGSAYACLDCEHIRRTAPNNRCTVCGSSSVFSLAGALSRRTN